MRSLRSTLVVQAVALIMTSAAVSAQEVANESQVKAAFLYNFAAFTEWPEGDGDTLLVGVVGDDGITELIAGTISGKTVSDRVVTIRSVTTAEEASAADILYFTDGSSDRRAEFLPPDAEAHALVVGEAEGFAEDGGMVNFYIDQGRVRFEINVDEVEDAGLRMSSRLLRLARIVSDAPDP